MSSQCMSQSLDLYPVKIFKLVKINCCKILLLNGETHALLTLFPWGGGGGWKN